MRRVRRQQIRYGLPAGVLLFVAGWAITAFLTPDSLFPEEPRWRVTLWVYLGTHLVELSDVYTGGIGMGTLALDQFAPNVTVDWLPLVPISSVAIASLYTCRELPYTTRMKYNVRNAATAGAGYFLTGLAAMIATDMQPSFTAILGIALVVGVAVWLGSSFVGAMTRGVPFIGITSLGTVAMIGVLLLIGGVALVDSIWGLILISFGVSSGTGVTVGTSRTLEEKGRNQENSRFPRVSGIRTLLNEYGKEIGGTLIVVAALAIGLR